MELFRGLQPPRKANLLQNSVYLLVTATVLVLLIVPIVFLVFKSFSDGFLTFRPWTLSKWERLFTPTLAFIILNSVVFALPASIIETLLGTYFAWIIEHTDSPYSDTFRQLIILPYLIPTAVVPLAWILLLDPNVGFINDLARELGLPVFRELYGIWGMYWAAILQGVPIGYLLTSSSIRNMDSAYIDAAIISNTHPLRIFWDQVVKMNRPAVLSAWVLAMGKNIGSVGIPLLLGVPGGFFIMASAIPEVTSSGIQPDYGLGAALGVPMLILNFAVVLIYVRYTRQSDRFTSMGGNRVRNLRTSGALKFGNTTLLSVYIFVAAILPISILVVQAFTKEVSILGTLTWSVENYAQALGMERIRSSIVTTVGVGLFVAVVAALWVAAISWIDHETSIPFTNRLSEHVYILAHTPTIVVSMVALLILVNTPLYATPFVFILPLMFIPLSISVRYISPSIAQQPDELTEAGYVSGDTNMGLFYRVGVPLSLGSILSAIANNFVNVVRNLSSVFFLVTPGANILAFEVFHFTQITRYNTASVLSLLLILMGSSGWFIATFVRERYER